MATWTMARAQKPVGWQQQGIGSTLVVLASWKYYQKHMQSSSQPTHGSLEWNAHLDAAVINENIVHLEVGLLAGLVVVKAQESVAQAVPRLPVLDDVTGCDCAKPREDDLQILQPKVAPSGWEATRLQKCRMLTRQPCISTSRQSQQLRE